MSDIDPKLLYGESYYQHGCGIPYERSDHWIRFFGVIADQLVQRISPHSSLDAGCAMGFLVESLRDRGVDAYGCDISEYAISRVRDDIRPYCRVGSLVDPLPRRYDLITCIEVLEHMNPADGERAIAALCAASDDIVFSSTPDDYREPTHLNVQPQEYWAELFARHGMWHDAEFDASFITPWAIRFRRTTEPPHRIIVPLERKLARIHKENKELRQQLIEQQTLLDQKQVQLAEHQNQLDQIAAENLHWSLQQSQEERAALIEEYEAQLSAVQQNIRELQDRLNRIETRRSYKALYRLWRAQMKVMPPESLRFRAWRKLTQRSQGALSTTTSASVVTTEHQYRRWIAEHEPTESVLAQQRIRAKTLGYKPLFSLIMPVYNPPVDVLHSTLQSVFAQTYGNWELCIVDGGSDSRDIRCVLEEAAQHDPRVHVQFLPQNLGISGNSNEAARLASGEFIAIVDHDDLLAPNALYEVALVLNDRPDADLIYYDEDHVTQDGRTRRDPLMKPDWSPEMLLSANYLTHSVLRRDIFLELGGFNPEFDGTQDWDLVFRFTERTNAVVHIPKVLYHWRMIEGSAALSFSAKPYVFERQLRCISEHLVRVGISHPRVEFTRAGRVRVQWPTGNARVSIIIPTKDKVRLVRPCIDSILNKTAYPDFEVIIVDTGSREQETQRYYNQLKSNPRVRIVNYKGDFNWSAANNLGAREAAGDLLLFLNNDIEVFDPGWLEELVRWAQRPEIGIVGTKLLYPSGAIQHAGVVIGMEGHASHVFMGMSVEADSPFGSTEWYRTYSAVTGACQMVRRDVFAKLGGFDENYILVFSDIEFCLRAVNNGFRVMYTPFAPLYHHEGGSRGKSMPTHDLVRAYEQMLERIEVGDPYYNPNLTYAHHTPSLSLPGEEKRTVRLKRIMDPYFARAARRSM